MKIAKPILVVATPLGVAGGLYEAWQLAGGLVLVMASLVAVMSVGIGSVILVARRERREAEAAAAAASSPVAGAPPDSSTVAGSPPA